MDQYWLLLVVIALVQQPIGMQTLILGRVSMTTFTTEDREQAEKEPIPFYGLYDLRDSSPKDNVVLHPVLRNIKVEYRVDDSSEDLED